MSYFEKVKEGQEVFGLVFGHGVVANVWENGFYAFEVEYDNNGHTVPYTEEGVPAWAGTLDFQTVFYKKDIDLMELDTSINTEKVLTPKKIIKLRIKGNLEVKCPNGIWRPALECPRYVSEGYLEEKKFHLFRKAK